MTGVTLREVAERAGVSRSAVSRTFTEGASVSPAMRRKVEKAAAELGYFPNALASSLTTGRTRLIGLVSDNFHNPVFLEVFDRFTRGLQQRQLRPLLVNLSDGVDPDEALRMLRQYSVDGVLVASTTLTPGFSESCRQAGLPVVHAFGQPRDRRRIHLVGVDNVAVGQLAAQTLLDRGYRRIGFLGGPQEASSTQDRLAGLQSGLSCRSDVSLCVTHARAYTFDAGRDEMQRQLAIPTSDGRHGGVQAWFCADDVLCIGALSALQDAGLGVPRDVGLLGVNDMEIAGWQNIGLTTIRQPIAEIIDAAISLVVEMLDEPKHRATSRLFTGTLVERRTLRAPCRAPGQDAC